MPQHKDELDSFLAKHFNKVDRVEEDLDALTDLLQCIHVD